jgi:NAD(P)-dependent dehydrogenase (short-subunit alcohol dehydrogenase family)
MAWNGFDLSGRVALITGGSKGLGKAMALGLAQAGADVFISSRHEDELRAALEEILAGTGRRGGFAVADMADRVQIAPLAQAAVDQMGRVDILINNAGTNQPQNLDEIEDEVWDRVMEINLSSVMALTRAVVPQMKQRRWGRIIHISSIMGFVSHPGRGLYSATKSALRGFARAGALELGTYGITVNCIAPGPFLTELPLSLLTQEQQARFAQNTALDRWGQPDELIGPTLLLASDAGSYITGTTLVVDGGWLAR